MDVTTERDGDTATVIVSGIVDMRGAGDLERALTALLGQRASRVIVDFGRVELLTSAGIRVLVAITRRLTAVGGALALCALNRSVQRVLDVSGLKGQFTTAATRAEARIMLAAAVRATPPSKLAHLLDMLIGEDELSPQAAPLTPAQRAGLAIILEPLIAEPTRR